MEGNQIELKGGPYDGEYRDRRAEGKFYRMTHFLDVLCGPPQPGDRCVTHLYGADGRYLGYETE